MNVRALLVLLSVSLALIVAPTGASCAVPDYVAAAVADPSRPAGDRKLDAARKPAEVLAHAGIRPGQVIGEFLPGGGYYTRLLSDIVGPTGKIYALETTTWGADNINAAEAVLNEPGHKNVSLDLS